MQAPRDEPGARDRGHDARAQRQALRRHRPGLPPHGLGPPPHPTPLPRSGHGDSTPPKGRPAARPPSGPAAAPSAARRRRRRRALGTAAVGRGAKGPGGVPGLAGPGRPAEPRGSACGPAVVFAAPMMCNADPPAVGTEPPRPVRFLPLSFGIIRKCSSNHYYSWESASRGNRTAATRCC